MDAKLWKDMTPEEKGALLLAYHEGKVIQWCYFPGNTFKVSCSTEEGSTPVWAEDRAYRVKPEPKKPREFWLNPETYSVYISAQPNFIHVREVLE